MEENSSATSDLVIEVFRTVERGIEKAGFPATRKARSWAACGVSFSFFLSFVNCRSRGGSYYSH